MRSTRRVSISATTGCSGRIVTIWMSNWSASDAAAAMLAWTQERMSIVSALSSAMPASYRLISSRSVSSDSNRSSSSTSSSADRPRYSGKSARPS